MHSIDGICENPGSDTSTFYLAKVTFDQGENTERESALTRWTYNLSNTCFTPLRYLYNGWNVNLGSLMTEKVRSFKPCGTKISEEMKRLHCTHRSSMKTVAAWLFVLPGIVLGTLIKLSVYVFSEEVQNYHILVKNRLHLVMNPRLRGEVQKVGDKSEIIFPNPSIPPIRLSKIHACVIPLPRDYKENDKVTINNVPYCNEIIASVAKKIIFNGVDFESGPLMTALENDGRWNLNFREFASINDALRDIPVINSATNKPMKQIYKIVPAEQET